MQTIKQFLAKYTITSHTIVSFGTSLVLFYNFNTQFHDTVVNAYGHFPQYAKTIVELSIAYYTWYKTNKKATA